MNNYDKILNRFTGDDIIVMPNQLGKPAASITLKPSEK